VQRGRTDLRQPWVSLSWRVLAAGVVMAAVLLPLARFPIYVSLPAGAAVYLVGIYLLRAIEPDEWRLALRGLARFRPRRAGGQDSA
jgi:hypothetical protein